MIATKISKQFEANGGTMRMSDVIRLGYSRTLLYSLVKRGEIEQVSRGIYRLSDLPALGNPDLVTVSLRCPKAVVCLVSALAFHELTTQIPHYISIALLRTSQVPTLDYPPIRIHRFSEVTHSAGIEELMLDGFPVHVYAPEKTLADCFKFRNKIGMDIILEALKLYRERGQFDVAKLMAYARLCRVEKIMRPYLESLL